MLNVTGTDQAKMKAWSQCLLHSFINVFLLLRIVVKIEKWFGYITELPKMSYCCAPMTLPIFENKWEIHFLPFSDMNILSVEFKRFKAKMSFAKTIFGRSEFSLNKSRKLQLFSGEIMTFSPNVLNFTSIIFLRLTGRKFLLDHTSDAWNSESSFSTTAFELIIINANHSPLKSFPKKKSRHYQIVQSQDVCLYLYCKALCALSKLQKARCILEAAIIYCDHCRNSES